MADSFGARSTLRVGDRSFTIHRLDALAQAGDVERMPYSLRILAENLLRHEDGSVVTAEDVAAVAGWDPAATPSQETRFTPARVLLQDFTGVPAIVDLAAMRDAMAELGGDPAVIEPRLPAELVIDHSIIADVAGVPDAFRRNAELEFARNRERYAFLRWGQDAFRRLAVVPPNTGIVHQVNLEYLARVVVADGEDPAGPQAYPDTLVGTDSHTPMVNGLGVLGWGVGGIEAEAAMLGQPISMLIPQVVGFCLSGELPEGSTATDLVLTVTELLRRHGVVGKFVEFYGPGVASVPLANRATIGNMSPEYGSTCAIFPIDDETLRYLAFTGRDPEQVALVEAYAKEQGLFHDPTVTPVYSEALELDLSTVVPSLAGPTRPQDRVPLDEAPASLRTALRRWVPVIDDSLDEAVDESFPASDPPAPAEHAVPDPGRRLEGTPAPPDQAPVSVRLADGTTVDLAHGHVVIAAITSCTNTSNPSVMLAAGLLARKAVERGLTAKPWVKTSLAPGSQVVTDYYERAGLTPALEKLGFHLVGYGCTTCIGNSGPLAPEISAAVHEHDLAVASVLSGNRNFEGRINPDCKLNYLASPPLVVAYALAGSMDVNLLDDPLGHDHDGQPVYLRDVWPSSAEVTATVEEAISSELFAARYADVFRGDERWRGLDVPTGDRFAWDPDSTYVRRPTFFDGLPLEPSPVTDITGARALVVLGDSVTTDHISPAGAIATGSAAGRYLQDHGVPPAQFNSYGSRRGNHEVMARGTFANIRLRNQLAPGTEGAVTVHLPSGERMSIYEAAMRYQTEDTPLVVLAGVEYGSGSSRDWAAKGPALLGVRAVIAGSYERIHRSNLIGMGILPLQFADGDSVASLGLSGSETFDIVGLAGVDELPRQVTVRADGRAFTATVRIDTPREVDYFRHGGILSYVLRQLLAG
ncbi:MAG TPA: aconitate hydratase [Egibacteraceae bacterium]|nr:aconitate hydratase [Egibacteraceae bacterium]